MQDAGHEPGTIRKVVVAARNYVQRMQTVIPVEELKRMSKDRRAAAHRALDAVLRAKDADLGKQAPPVNPKDIVKPLAEIKPPRRRFSGGRPNYIGPTGPAKDANALGIAAERGVEPERHAAELVKAIKEKRPFSIRRQTDPQPSLFGPSFNTENLPKPSAKDSRAAAHRALDAVLRARDEVRYSAKDDNAFTRKKIATLTQDADGRFTLRGYTVKADGTRLFAFAYVYPTREKAVAAAKKYGHAIEAS